MSKISILLLGVFMAILSKAGANPGVLAHPPQDNMGIENLYKAFSGAETEAFDNPWIRTTFREAEGGSTAFGPVQLTGNLVKNYLLNKPEVIQDKDFANKYLMNARKFAEHGNNKGKIPHFNPDYDYGGQGGLTTEADYEGYSKLSKAIMSDLWAKAKTTDKPLENMIKYWRWGEGSDKSRDDDPEYFKRFFKHLGE